MPRNYASEYVPTDTPRQRARREQAARRALVAKARKVKPRRWTVKESDEMRF